ncbi:9302b175-5bc5-44b2-9144-4febcefeff90 [Thermothielavioides terrestris]|uniref:Uncharacterized protein n=2 Tax=Thermothielavioides terrestris TaxID=2587410 RepID=G2RDR0_THETT|nr:uncharacterized protein THITE_2081166 [Thermothielavioides terrestris NRRL 8126]AEO69991.1 hypothetical protein THITE_2081166 [Thermothielavioides terrestris NRRL 8126]SPQ17787.1 9302b175-5bc5-44b2-9144-4febcefeff90 [Thermothielavioides terrestris]
METQTRSRPELRPVWTGRELHPTHPRPSPLSATSPLYSASLHLPSPMYPASPSYDQAMRAHERALVDRLDRLDQRGKRESQPSPTTARSLSSVSERTLSARRPSAASLPIPRAPEPSPRSPGFPQYPRRQTLVAEARSILLSGLPDGLPDGLPRTPTDTASTLADRRQSLPPSFHSQRRRSQQLLQELRDWGRVYFCNADARVADCFVAAVALRRPSDSSSPDDEALAVKDELTTKRRHRVTIRARVRPCALHQKPFLIRRTFDMDELRATIPEPLRLSSAPRRPSAELPSRGTLPTNQRGTSAATSAEQDLDLEAAKSPVRSINTLPIHLKYARAFFPVLAALLYSGHIQKGDIIDLPLPYPEAWFQTVAHVYTGQGELTEAMKQNILYLGGKV